MPDVIPSTGTMAEIIVTSQGLKLLWAVIACAALFGLLRLRDWLIGVRFREVAARMTDDPVAAAIYYGASAIAIGLLIGMLMGR